MKKLTLIFFFLAIGATLYAQDLDLVQLDQKVQELERRIELLEKAFLAQSAEPSDDSKIKPSANKEVWRKLKRGMSQEQVKKLLGEPDKIMVMGSTTYWTIANTMIQFDDSGLYSWVEPWK